MAQRRQLTIRGGEADEKAAAAMAGRIEGLTESCVGTRLNMREQVVWPSLLGDLAAVSTSLRLLREATPNNSNTLACVPSQIPLDVQAVRTVPDVLYTCPSDEEYAEAAMLMEEYRATLTTGASGKIGASTHDLKEWKLRLQGFNRMLQVALVASTDAASATVGANSRWVSKAEQAAAKARVRTQRDKEDLTEMLNKFYAGSSLEIYS